MAEHELLDILSRTISSDPTDQQRALSYIQQASEHNFPEFVKQLSTILANAQNVAFARQAAGLQLKNTLASNEDERKLVYQQRWLTLPDEIKNYVKQCIVQTLGTESRPSSAAQCISAIAAVEIPLGQWLSVIDVLKANVTNTDSPEALKEASLETLGYICQGLPPSCMEAFANNVLTAIVFGMREAETSMHVKFAATNALLNSLDFTHTNFQNEQERNVIMEHVCRATQAPHDNIKVVALQCLVKIMSLYYQYMEKYMVQALFPITINAMKSEVDEIVLQGIEFWSNVCEEEAGLALEAQEAIEEGRPPNQVSRHYAMGALTHLIPLLTETLTKQEEDPEDDDWIPAKAASVCIMLLAQCCRDAIIEPTLPFISNNFGNESWNYREAAVNAFGSILDGPDPSTLLRLVEQAIGPLIERISDTHVAVRDTAVWAVGRVCDLCVELVSKPDIIKLLLPALFQTLQGQPGIAGNTCWTISSLVKATYSTAVAQGGTDENGEPETFILSACFKQLIDELIKTSERSDATVGLRNSAYESLMELVKNSPRDCYAVVKDTTVVVLKKMEGLMNVEATLSSATDRAQLRDLISQLCAMLQSVLRKFHETDALAVSEPIMRSLFQIMNRYQGKDNGAVMEEALMAVSALITVLKTNFNNFMPAFKPILMQALSNYSDKDVCINAMGVITDLCTVLESNVSAYSDEFVQCLVTILNDPNADKTVKCFVIQLLGDLINALGHHYSRYLEVTMVYVCNAVEVANLPVQPDDYDQAEYVNSLRESCIIVFTAIVQSFNTDPEQRRVIEVYFPMIEQLVKSIAASQPPATDSLLASTLGLVGDLVVTFGANIVSFAESEHVGSIISRLRRSKQSKARTSIRYITQEISRVRRQVSTA